MAMMKQVLDSNCSYSIDAVCAPPPKPKAATAKEVDAPGANGGGGGGGGGSGCSGGVGGTGVDGKGEVDSDSDENEDESSGDVASMILTSDLVVIFDLNPLCLKPKSESQRSSLGSPMRRGLARPQMKSLSPKAKPANAGAASSSADAPSSPANRRARQRWRAAAKKVQNSPTRAPASPFADGAAGGEAKAEVQGGACSGILKTIASVEPTKACFVVYIEPVPSPGTAPTAEVESVREKERHAAYQRMESIGSEKWLFGSSVPSTLVHNIANALQKAVDKATERAAAAAAAKSLSPKMLGNSGRRPSILRGGVEWTRSHRSLAEDSESRTSEPKDISFGAVDMRFFDTTIGESCPGKGGAALGLDWDWKKHGELSWDLEELEEFRGGILPENEEELEDEEWDENWRTPAAYFDEDGRVSEADRFKRLEEAGVPRIEVLLNGYLVQRTLDSRKRYERSKVGSMMAGPKMGHSHLVPAEDVEKAIHLDREYDAQLNASRVLGAFVTRLSKRRRAGA